MITVVDQQVAGTENDVRPAAVEWAGNSVSLVLEEGTGQIHFYNSVSVNCAGDRLAHLSVMKLPASLSALFDSNRPSRKICVLNWSQPVVLHGHSKVHGNLRSKVVHILPWQSDIIWFRCCLWLLPESRPVYCALKNDLKTLPMQAPPPLPPPQRKHKPLWKTSGCTPNALLIQRRGVAPSLNHY